MIEIGKGGQLVRPQKPMASTECHLDPCQALHLSISIRHGSKWSSTKHHFTGAGKQIQFGKGAIQTVGDYHLSRFACYLIAQNGDSRKPEISHAQKYFAIQTRRQELSDAAIADLERLELRKQTSQDFKALSGAARDAGVQNKMFGIFHDAGYKGL